ncbi:hypothetical protein BX661DRAFT_179726 [Kickxella alabastrina]|uniref:uncharacterized protein n=1 Tax=Kickxella alabastrina TaxID=61397 RepID=UPI00221F2787|nr:uncharacterized protein BX661DRAFT_179726 [Kickxella alabastrina]KAI7832051.1 hypothetical protein BX661DRAFT_179726 [Kickxella alabastrina]
MLFDLVMFLRANHGARLSGVGDDMIGMFDLALAKAEHTIDEYGGSYIFNISLDRLNRCQSANTDCKLFWAHMLIDCALLQSLEYILLGDKTKHMVSVLNNLDRAIIVGGASMKRLHWIHRVHTVNINNKIAVDLKFPLSRYSVDEYLRMAVGHHRLVPVEVGAKYTDSEIDPFGHFLDNRLYPSANSTSKLEYLAQHDLFAQAFRLKRDFSLPDYTQVETGRRSNLGMSDGDVETNVWIGPCGTVSPLHYDQFDNLFAQVVGYKYFRLYSSAESDNLYPHSKESLLGNTSRVDVEHPDFEKFSAFEKASYVECVVKPGDLLYIPPRWWHFVRALSVSASISMWF